MTPPTLIEQEPRVGRFLHDLVSERQYSDFFPLDDAADLGRPKPFFPDPPEAGIGPFGQYMLNPAFRRYRTEAVAAYAFDNVQVIGADGVVILPSGVLRNTLDHLATALPESNIAAVRRGEYVRLRREMPVRPSAEAARVVIGFTGGWRQHSHWLAQCLPKLYAYTLLRRRFRDLKLALPALAPGSAQHRTLALLGIGADAVVTLAANEAASFASAIVLPNFDIWSIAPFAAQAAERLAAGIPQAPARPERVYIHRAGASAAVTNFAAVRALAERHGFTVHQFEGTELADQAAAMRAARLVIIEHGAGTSNLLFCRPGARVLELFNPYSVQPMGWSIAARRDTEYGYLIGQHSATPEHPEPGWHSAYEIDLDRLAAAIAILAPQAAAEAEAEAQPAAPPPAPPLPLPSPRPAAAVGGSGIAGVTEPIFDLTADVGAFAQGGAHQRILLFPAALPPPAPPLHRQADLPPEFAAEHLRYPAPAGVHAYALKDAVLWGHGLTTLGGAFAAPAECFPGYLRRSLQPGGAGLHPLHAGALGCAEPQTLALDHPVASVLHPNLVFGHFLMEMLPRLYGLSVLRQFGADFPLLLPAAAPAWLEAFVALLHPAGRIIRYDAATQRVTAPAIVLPGMMHTEHNFHPAMNLPIEALRQAGSPDPAAPDLIHVARASVGDERIDNDDEVAATLADLGFVTVRPHEMTPGEAIRLFAGARAVVGEYGPALHGALFAPRGTPVIALNFLNHYQSRIARLRGHRLAFVPPADGRFRHWRIDGPQPYRFRIDPAALRKTVLAMLAAAP